MESPTAKGFLLGIGLMALLVIAFLAGGYFRDTKNSTPETKNIVKINEEKQIASPEQIIQKEPVTTPTAAQDSRQLISSQTKYTQDYIVKTFLPEQWNTEAPTTTVAYNNPQKGIEIVLPFNPLWGTKNYKAAPYETTKDGIDFGFMEICGEGAGCLARQYSLSFSPAKSLSDEMKPTAPTMTVKSFKVGTVMVVQADEEPGLCSATFLTVIGKKFNYSFSGPCGLSSADVEKLKTVIATIKFI